MHEGELLAPTHIFLALLAAATLTGLCVRFVKVPYTIALVITGLAVTVIPGYPRLNMTPELVLMVFLPGLLFEASWTLDLKQLRANWLPIGLMATVGVLLSTVLVGAVVALLGGLHWQVSLALGAMLSATDPVSVIAMFRRIGVSKRLTLLIEGESLLNDGTAVVVFRIVAGIVAAGGAFSAWGAATNFAVVVAGGIAVGVIAGLIACLACRLFDDHSMQITCTVIATYGTYWLADQLGVSPVIAVVTTGIVFGNIGMALGMSPTLRLAVSAFWEYIAFLINSVLFILVGSTIELQGLVDNAGLIAIGVLGILLARAFGVYGLCLLCGGAHRIPLRWQHVLFWGGLRGALSMALALSLPMDFPHRTELLHTTFGVVLFTLFVQGWTIEPLIKRLGLRQTNAKLEKYQEIRAQLMALSVQNAELERMRVNKEITQVTFDTLKTTLRIEQELYERLLRELKEAAPELASLEVKRTQRELAVIRKDYLMRLFKENLLTAEQCSQLTIESDEELDSKSEHDT